jgi:hypothetical protein
VRYGAPRQQREARQLNWAARSGPVAVERLDSLEEFRVILFDANPDRWFKGIDQFSV